MTTRTQYPLLDLNHRAFLSTDTFKSFFSAPQILEPEPQLPPPACASTDWQLLFSSGKSFGNRWILSLFLKIVHPHIKTWAPMVDRQIDLWFRYSIHEANSFSVLTNRNILWRSLNTYRPGTEDYLKPMLLWLRIRKFKDNKYVFGLLFPIKLYSRTGLCRGMCEWFAFRYFCTLSSFASPRDCILSLAKYFEYGADHGSILLQAIEKKLALQAVHHILGMDLHPPILCQLEDRQDGSKTIQKQDFFYLDSLQTGLYYIGLFGKHRILIIKTEEADYIFDPSEGCFEYQKGLFTLELIQRIEFYALVCAQENGFEPVFTVCSVQNLNPSNTHPVHYTIEAAEPG